ncbi:MAG: hypothetical protein RLZ12_35 [Bacillota bacterium]
MEHFQSERPIYLQVMEKITRRILCGELGLGARLLAVRELAVQFKINPNTVQRAYVELERSGVIETRRGMGSFVTRKKEVIETLRQETLYSDLNSFVQAMQALGCTLSEVQANLRACWEGQEG